MQSTLTRDARWSRAAPEARSDQRSFGRSERRRRLRRPGTGTGWSDPAGGLVGGARELPGTIHPAIRRVIDWSRRASKGFRSRIWKRPFRLRKPESSAATSRRANPIRAGPRICTNTPKRTTLMSNSRAGSRVLGAGSTPKRKPAAGEMLRQSIGLGQNWPSGRPSIR